MGGGRGGVRRCCSGCRDSRKRCGIPAGQNTRKKSARGGERLVGTRPYRRRTVATWRGKSPEGTRVAAHRRRNRRAKSIRIRYIQRQQTNLHQVRRRTRGAGGGSFVSQREVCAEAEGSGGLVQQRHPGGRNRKELRGRGGKPVGGPRRRKRRRRQEKQQRKHQPDLRGEIQGEGEGNPCDGQGAPDDRVRRHVLFFEEVLD